jgi:hypothetical protein
VGLAVLKRRAKKGSSPLTKKDYSSPISPVLYFTEFLEK